jgi:hypothetical protein
MLRQAKQRIFAYKSDASVKNDDVPIVGFVALVH